VLFRAATALFLQRTRKTFLKSVLGEWPDDQAKAIDTVIKAATAPAMLSSTAPAWASVLGENGVADLVVGLAPQSAAAALIARGLSVNLAGRSGMTVPSKVVTAADAGTFVKEGEPIPVRNLNIGGPLVEPFRIAAISAFSNVLGERAVSDVEAIIKQCLSEAAALALDAGLLSNAAAVADTRPAGILNGVSPLTATTGGGVNALVGDIKQLIATLASAGAGVAPVFITAPAQAASLKCLAGPKFDYPVLVSTTLASGTVIAIEPTSFVSAFGSTPEFDVSDEALLHMEADTPQQIGTPGPPNVIAAPARSLWQTNCTGVRMILRAGWAMRAAGHVQYVSGATW
jgi:Phage capsid family